MLESLDSGLVKLADRNNDSSWQWQQIEEKYEYTSKSSREAPDHFGSAASVGQILPPLKPPSDPHSAVGRADSECLKSNKHNVMKLKDHKLNIHLTKEDPDQGFSQQPNLCAIEHWEEGLQESVIKRDYAQNSQPNYVTEHPVYSRIMDLEPNSRDERKSVSSSQAKSELEEEDIVRDVGRDNDQNKKSKDQQIFKVRESPDGELLSRHEQKTPLDLQEEGNHRQDDHFSKKNGQGILLATNEVKSIDQNLRDNKQDINKPVVKDKRFQAQQDENQEGVNDQQARPRGDAGDRETQDKEIPNLTDKTDLAELPPLFVDGYRGAAIPTEPQWASGSRRSLFPPAKQAKVLPQLSKPSITDTSDVTLVTRSRKAARPRPASLLVMLFEGVLAINDREQNVADAGADFYEDSDEEEETDDDSEGNEQSSAEIGIEDLTKDKQDHDIDASNGKGDHDRRSHSDGTIINDGRGSKVSAKARIKKDGSGTLLSKQHTFKQGIFRGQQIGLETIKEESPRAPSRAEKQSKKALQNRKAKKKKKKTQQKAETIVVEESSQIIAPWMNRDEKGGQRPQLPGHCFYFRHGIARGLSKLKQEFFIVILLQRKNSTRRRKQIIRALEEQDLHFDAIYQHESLSSGDSRGNSMGGSRFFSISQIVRDTAYSPARTVFLTSVDQSQYNYDINEYLEKDMMPPKFEPKPHDFGLLPLPYTVSRLEVDERAPATDQTGFRLDIHKLVVIGVPHVLQNNDQPSMNKSKAISFKQICCTIKNFNQLCLSFEPVPGQDQRSDSELPDEEPSQSESQQSEESEESWDSGTPKYFVKDKYRRIFEPQKQVHPKEVEPNTGDDASHPKKPKQQNNKELNEQPVQQTHLDDAAHEKGGETKVAGQKESEESSFDDEESSESELLIKEPKVFYKGFKKAREHSMFSLIYQSFPLLAQKALSERFMSCLLKYRSKITKIDGLACRLVRLKEKQALEDKENSINSPYQQQSSAKDNVQRYEALRRQPGLQALMQHLRTYYKEVYDECVLPHSKIAGQASSKESGTSLHTSSQIQSQLNNHAPALNPTLDQLRRLRSCYVHEVTAIEKLLCDSIIDFQKSYSIMSLSGQLYTAKRMTNYGASSEFQFKAKLIVAGQQQQQQQAAQRKETKELPNELEEDEHVPGDQEAALDQRRESAPNLQHCGIFSSVDGKRITNLRNQIPVEQVRNVLDWLSKKAPSHQVQYQIIQPN